MAQPGVSRGSPSTFAYKFDDRPPQLEIIIDVHPELWERRYRERATFEDTPIIFRPAGVARGHALSGDKLIERGRPPSDYGTLCGYVSANGDEAYALTCGHVVENGAQVLRAAPRRLGIFRLGTQLSKVGVTSHHVRCPLPSAGNADQPAIDAALISTGSLQSGLLSRRVVPAAVKPISTIIQEERVRFRGASRSADKLARVAAITVRKSMDLYRDGSLYDVGDVLMLGHRQPMYFVQSVSRPGDSGAAVREDYPSSAKEDAMGAWQGMILGGDESAAYATHAEHLMAWSKRSLGMADIDFHYSV